MNKISKKAFFKVLLVTMVVVFLTSLWFLIFGEPEENGRLVNGLMAISSFFTGMSFFLRLTGKNKADNNKSY